MSENLTITATENLKKIRLDKFLAESFPQYSRNQFIRLIEEGAVQILGQKGNLSPDDKVVAGATYTIIPPEPVEANPEPENIPLDIVYEDEDLLVINKPAGLVVHPGAGNWTGTMVNALLSHCGKSLSGINGRKTIPLQKRRPIFVRWIPLLPCSRVLSLSRVVLHLGLNPMLARA